MNTITWREWPIWEQRITCTHNYQSIHGRCSNRAAFAAFVGIVIVAARCAEHASAAYDAITPAEVRS